MRIVKCKKCGLEVKATRSANGETKTALDVNQYQRRCAFVREPHSRSFDWKTEQCPHLDESLTAAGL